MSNLLDKAQRRIYREGLNDHLEESRRARRQAEYDAAFAELDAQQAIVGSGLEKYGHAKIQEMRAELTRMYEEEMGERVAQDDGGYGSIVFNPKG